MKACEVIIEEVIKWNLSTSLQVAKDAQKHLQDTIQNKFRIGQYRFLLQKKCFVITSSNAHEEVNMWGALLDQQI